LILNNPIPSISIFNNTFLYDFSTNYIKVILLIGSIVIILFSFNYLKEEKCNIIEFFILILLSILGLCMLISSYDLISMYLSIETQSLCLYTLAAIKRNSAFSTEAGLKYFILGALSSGLILFGSCFIYGATGTFNFEEIGLLTSGLALNNLNVSGIIITGFVLILSGLLFKLAAAPFHMWSPDVYEGAPTAVTAFFATIPKIAILVLIIRILNTSFFNFFDF